MAKIASDTPKYITEMLEAVDFEKITQEQYLEWTMLIIGNIGQHIARRTEPVAVTDLEYPIKQGFLDIINQYNFNTLPKTKRLAVVPLAKNWANNNLPLKHKIK
ncbi:MAG: hypothetical protein LBO69_05540 [Ignavibacteria bacterium]|jgi:hypothetical protein|nr:hypothetical protein [Ignavibacteria bacterium]